MEAILGVTWGIGFGVILLGVPAMLTVLAVLSMWVATGTPLGHGWPPAVFLVLALAGDAAALWLGRPGRRPTGRLLALLSGLLVSGIYLGALFGPAAWVAGAAPRGAWIVETKGREVALYIAGRLGRALLAVALAVWFFTAILHG